MSIKEQLDQLKAAYARTGLDCGDGLRAPASEEAIEQLGVRLGVKVPEELCAVLRIHGGQDYISPGITGFFGEHRLHSPQEIVEQHQMYQTHCLLDPLPEFPPKAGNWGYWVPSLIPFGSWDAYDLCIDSHRLDVWEFCPNIGLTMHLPSIASLLESLIEAVNAGKEPKLPSRHDIQ